MRFSVTAVLALAGCAVAQIGDNPDINFDQIDTPDTNEVVTAGKSFTIKWTLKPATQSGPVTILLAGGASQGTLNNLSTIATGVDNSAGSYVWNVDSNLGDKALYGIKIILESDHRHWQWSKGFKISGSGGSSSSSSSSSGSTSTTSTTGTDSATTTGPTTTSSPVVVQTSTAVVSSNRTISTSSPKPTTSAPGSGAAGVSVGAAALLGGLAIAALGL